MSDEQGFRMRKVLTIDEIVERCREMEIGCAISVDAPLVTALNSRYSNPLFGFAYTPLNIASTVSSSILGTAVDTDLEICHRMMHITGESLRMVHSTLCKIRDIRRFTSDVSAYLLTRREKEIYEAFRQTRSMESVMESFDDGDADRFYDNRRVCVIDTELFSEIDKRIPPVFREDISNASLDDVKTDWFHIDTIYSIGNDRQIAEAVADLISPDNCNDVAIVLDSGGDIAEAVRSELYRRNIPFKNNLAVKDLAVIRNYLRFMKDALDFRTIRAGDVRELFSAYGAFGPGCLTVNTDGYLLNRIRREHIEGKNRQANELTLNLIDLMNSISDGRKTFLEVVDDLPKIEGKSSIKILIRDMGLEDETVTKEHLTDLEYAVNNITDLKHNEQIPEDERRGVLIADCRNSTYIDRPLVFFIGLDNAWHNSPSGRDYIRDPLGFEEKEAMRLRILLQQGDRRIYIIRPATGGKETIPCQTFETIADIEGHPCSIERFSDICGNIVTGSWHSASTVAAPVLEVRETPDVEPVVFSKSEYNCWCDCPVKFVFKKVLKDNFQESEATLFGDCIHDFAEFAYCFPDLAHEYFDTYAENLLERYSGISSSCMEEFDRGKFRTIMSNLMYFMDNVDRSNLVLDGDNSKRTHPNLLIAGDERTGNLYSTNAESYFPSCDGHAFYAKPDLIIGDSLIDYKSGGGKKIKEVLAGFNGNKVLSEYQPLMYLKAFQENREASGSSIPVDFKLLFLGDRMAETNRDGNIGRCMRTVRFVDKMNLQHLKDCGYLDHVENNYTQKKYLPLSIRWPEVWEGMEQIMSDGVIPDNTFLSSALSSYLKFNNVSMKKKVSDFVDKFLKGLIVPAVISDTIVVDREYMEKFASDVDVASVEARKSLCLPLFAAERDDPYCRSCDYKSVCMYRFADDMKGGTTEGDDSQ